MNFEAAADYAAKQKALADELKTREPSVVAHEGISPRELFELTWTRIEDLALRNNPAATNGAWIRGAAFDAEGRSITANLNFRNIASTQDKRIQVEWMVGGEQVIVEEFSSRELELGENPNPDRAKEVERRLRVVEESVSALERTESDQPETLFKVIAWAA